SAGDCLAGAGLRVMGWRLLRWRAEERRQLGVAAAITLTVVALLDGLVLPRTAAALVALTPAPLGPGPRGDGNDAPLGPGPRGAGNDATRPAPAALPERTATAAQPPPQIGPDYDDDRRMARHARPVASYDLAARLDADRHAVTGKGTIRWT